MLDRFNFWKRREPEAAPEPEAKTMVERKRESAFSTARLGRLKLDEPRVIDLPGPKQFTRSTVAKDGTESITFDEACKTYGMDATMLKQAFVGNQGVIPDDIFDWFASQSFIGYQACALVSQHWLVKKVLDIPAKDAIRNGYELATDDGEELDVDVLSKLKRASKPYKINKNLFEFASNTRRFGYRIAIFVVESEDEDYYRKPFNIDGVKPGTYKGITQVDPSWVAPILDAEAAANPASMGFYEPTWWQISGQLYHKSHLVVARYAIPPDILKPNYQYGGIPLTQIILERVYAAERTANEGPMLAMTKRLNVLKVDLAMIAANPEAMEQRLVEFNQFRDNYAVFVGDLTDEITQIETSLTDLTDVINNQYQLVAAVAEMPATKLLAQAPTGLNATGESDMESYHELLENIQTDLDEVLERHYELLIRSDNAFDNGLNVVIVWNPVSSPSAKELSEINFNKAQTDNLLILAGVLSPEEARKRLIMDAKSNYSGIEADELEDDDDDDDDDELGDLEPAGVERRGTEEESEKSDSSEA